MNLFELNNLISKQLPINGLSLQILENLIPAHIEHLTSTKELEKSYLEYAQMKVTYKLSKLYFDKKAFLDHLDPNKQRVMNLDKLFGDIAEKLQIFFSVQEQIAIRNGLFPEHTEESVVSSRQRLVKLKDDYVEEDQGVAFD